MFGIIKLHCFPHALRALVKYYILIPLYTFLFIDLLLQAIKMHACYSLYSIVLMKVIAEQNCVHQYSFSPNNFSSIKQLTYSIVDNKCEGLVCKKNIEKYMFEFQSYLSKITLTITYIKTGIISSAATGFSDPIDSRLRRLLMHLYRRKINKS